ncbi:MAG: hypothetical protein LC775_00035, partial [Acidobacteria bacterium]|nr:hypothetical protein [Acidobacteriota bacterium]
LLAGEHLQRYVLGLITAAGGGLTLGDLEQLTEQPPFEFELLLGGVFGRSIGSRTGGASTGHPNERVYLFTHETLRLVAEQQFGNSLAAHRDRIHTWADSYRQRGWPADTPQYLLRSYPRMLASAGDLARLVACATDQDRHDRMRDLTDGDALAFTEISTAQQLILAQSDPDLNRLVRLAVQREHLIDRNRNIPAELPAVWAMLGQSTHGETLANSILDPYQRAWALAALAEVVTCSSEPDRAIRLAADAETVAAWISEPKQRATALAWTAVAAAMAGDGDRAARLASEASTVAVRITDPKRRADALVNVTAATTRIGNDDQVAWLARKAKTVGARITKTRLAAGMQAGRVADSYSRACTLTELAAVAADAGEGDQAAQLASEAEAVATSDIHSYRRARGLTELAVAANRAGENGRAIRLASETETVLARLDGEDIPPTIRRSTYGFDFDIFDLDRALAKLAAVAAANCEYKLAETFIARMSDHYPDLRGYAVAELSVTVARGGDHDRAKGLTEQITDDYERTRALLGLAVAANDAGEHDQTSRLIESIIANAALIVQITNNYRLMRAVTELAVAAARGSEYELVKPLIMRIIEHTSPWPTRALEGLDSGVARGVEHQLAEALIMRMTSLEDQVHALIEFAGALNKASKHEQAARLAEEASAIVRADALTEQMFGEKYPSVIHVKPMAKLAVTLARAGKRDQAAQLASEAEALTTRLTYPDESAEVLAWLAVAAAEAGEDDRGARLVEEAKAFTTPIADPPERAQVLARLTMALVGIERISPWRLGTESALPPLRHPHDNSPVMVWARHLLAEALANNSWINCVSELAHIDPLAFGTLADALQERWGLAAAADTEMPAVTNAEITESGADYSPPPQSRVRRITNWLHEGFNRGGGKSLRSWRRR